MSPVAQAVLVSWSFPPVATALNLFAALLYIRGWITLRAGAPARFTIGRLSSFLCGLAVLEIALASPIDAFDPFFLTDHMLQHMLLMMIVPQLVLLGEPEIPIMRGLPRWLSQRVLNPILSARPVQSIGRGLVHPAVVWLLMALAMIGWHVPKAYELALDSPRWHEVEHICFLGAAMLFWWPVIQPWPSRALWPRWTMPIYLLLADFVNSAVSAFLAFSDRVLYASYLAIPRLWGIAAQNDQVAAGAMMWVVGSFAFLIPAVAITVKLLSPVGPKGEQIGVPDASAARSSIARSVLAALAVALPAAALACGYLTPDSTDIDDAALRVQQVSGPFRVSIFAPADPVEPGPFDLSILVQDADSGSPLLDAAVDIAVQPPTGRPRVLHASHAESANKLLAAATAELPRSGAWNVRVSVRRGVQEAAVSTKLQVLPSKSAPGTVAADSAR
jgi:cytochrome c oxidase assembly factor CtaG